MIYEYDSVLLVEMAIVALEKWEMSSSKDRKHPFISILPKELQLIDPNAVKSSNDVVSKIISSYPVALQLNNVKEA